MPLAAKTALIVLDMINLFDFEGGQTLGKSAVACARRIAVLRRRFDEGRAPVIYVNDNFMHWHGEFRDLIQRCSETGGASARIVRTLEPRSGDYYVLKPKHSAFLATPLAVLLEKLEVRQLVLTGVAADSCILATAMDAKMQEFNAWIPRDAVAAITLHRTRTALTLLSRTLDIDIRPTTAVDDLFPAPS